MLKKTLTLVAAAAAMVGMTQMASAATTFSQGFETNTSGWIGGAGIQQVGPSLSSDGQYAKLTAQWDGYSSGYSDLGHTYFGGRSGVYNGSFTQSVDIYIDTNWAAPTNSSVAAFWLDMAPANTSGTSNYAAENSFNFYVDGSGSVDVAATGAGDANSFATISTSGWYTFAMTFGKNASAIQTTLSVARQGGGSQLGTATVNSAAGAAGTLGSGGYAWLSVWQNGFANQTLLIDNLQSTASVAPVPATLPAGLALLGLCGLGMMIHRRRRSAA